MTTWNQERESIIAAAELGDAPAKTAVALLVDARKRAHDAARDTEAHKTAAIRLREDLVERTSERDAAREELKTLRHNLMAITAQEQERTEQLAMAEAACRRDATALGVVQAELAGLKAAHAWLKTSENTPDLHQMVLGFDQNGDVELVRYLGINRWKYAVLSRSEPLITHWMPLPEAPK